MDLFLTSPLAGTDGPVELSAGGLWARGEEGLSFSSTSVVTTSTVSSSCIGVSGESTEEKSVSKHDALNTPHTSLSNTTQHWPLWLSLLRDFFSFFKSAFGFWWKTSCQLQRSYTIFFFQVRIKFWIHNMSGKLWNSCMYVTYDSKPRGDLKVQYKIVGTIEAGPTCFKNALFNINVDISFATQLHQILLPLGILYIPATKKGLNSQC